MAERLWLSWSKATSMPAAANLSLRHVSMKKPRSSPSTCGSTISAPSIGVGRNFTSPPPAPRAYSPQRGERGIVLTLSSPLGEGDREAVEGVRDWRMAR